ncbi:unnamed protein product [Macrosiphum euphorbiae]|uniref:Uncharacterized protein n=1 Tax=Macrosiphum euphorbiae TaxID=13131 RepID=A0AAV0Y1E4_9HEMI|nr:unnamed protein product [Macrosiphum euphorbiae]
MCSASTSSNTTVVGTESDIEIIDPPSTYVSAMEFSSYHTIRNNYLAASCFDRTVRLWEVRRSRKNEPKTVIEMPSLILDIAWSIHGRGVYMASIDNQLQFIDFGKPNILLYSANNYHDGPVRTCNVIKKTNYISCIMTGSWDKTIKIWDSRCIEPVVTINLPYNIACADVEDDMAVVCTERGMIYVYELGPRIKMTAYFNTHQSESCSAAIFRDRRTGKPAGFTLGTPEGFIIPIYIDKSHDVPNVEIAMPLNNNAAVNDIKYHPINHVTAVLGSNGHCSFFNMEPPGATILLDKCCQASINKCCFNVDGTIFAYNTFRDNSQVCQLISQIKCIM